MNFRQAKLVIIARLIGYKTYKTLEGYHWIRNPNPKKHFPLIYLEDL